MQLSANTSLNRFEWAAKTANDLINQHYQKTKVVHYDVGAGQNSLVKQLSDKTTQQYSLSV
jgi:hypothetical protein